jgi:hypothetical protein
VLALSAACLPACLSVCDACLRRVRSNEPRVKALLCDWKKEPEVLNRRSPLVYCAFAQLPECNANPLFLVARSKTRKHRITKSLTLFISPFVFSF